MLRAFFRALKVRPDEQFQVVLLLVIGFFIGIFLATYQVSTETLFLNNLDEYLKEAILASGFFGVITTFLYSFFQNRVRFSRLVVVNFILICLFVYGVYYLFLHPEYSPVSKDVLIFIMFSMFWPLTAVILLSYWGIFGRLFNLRQSKRIIGWIDSGQLSAAIISFVSIPFLSSLIPNSASYLVIAASSLLVALIVLVYLTIKFNLADAESDPDEVEDGKGRKRGLKFSQLIKDNYILLLSLFLITSMVTFTFVHYSFQSVTAQQFPLEVELRNFLAIFNGAVLITSFLLQTFVNDKIIGDYGLKIALIILPIIVGVFTILSVLAGFFIGFDKNEIGVAFLWFFLFVAMTRFFSYTLRDSLENPSFKLYFMPLDKKVRFDIQTKVEGIVNESSRLLAGALIFGLSLLSFFELIHYSVVLVFLTIVYVIIVGKLHAQYRLKIRIKLESQKKEVEDQNDRVRIIKHLQRNLFSKENEKVIFSFNLLEKINPQGVPQAINIMMGNMNEKTKYFAQKKLNEIKGLSVSDKYIIKFENETNFNKGRYQLSMAEIELMLETGDIPKKRILKLTRSENFEDRQYAAELIGNQMDDEGLSYLIELLSDNNEHVRITAINTSEKRNNSEVLNSLIENLKEPAFGNISANTLVKIGEKALDELDIAFYRVGQDSFTQIRILQIIGRVGGKKAISMLWSKVSFPDKLLVAQVLKSLGECGFKASLSQISELRPLIEADISDVAWNLAALSEVPKIGFGGEIVRALKEENTHDIEHVYMLLSMLYDYQSIKLVKENLESGTTEGVIYAVELLDVLLSEQLKARVIPLFDDISDLEKAKKLEFFYPRSGLSQKEVLKFLINRDYNQTNRWTKSCVIHQIGLQRLTEFKDDLIANLFNPDLLVQEVAAWSLYNIEASLFASNIKRLETGQYERLNMNIGARFKNSNSTLIFEKVLFLKSLPYFVNVSGLLLTYLADYIDDVFIKEGDTLSLTRLKDHYFYIVYDGSINLYAGEEIKKDLSSGEFIGEMTDYQAFESNMVMAVKDSVLFKIDKSKFYELLADNIEFATKVINHI